MSEDKLTPECSPEEAADGNPAENSGSSHVLPRAAPGFPLKSWLREESDSLYYIYSESGQVEEVTADSVGEALEKASTTHPIRITRKLRSHMSLARSRDFTSMADNPFYVLPVFSAEKSLSEKAEKTESNAPKSLPPSTRVRASEKAAAAKEASPPTEKKEAAEAGISAERAIETTLEEPAAENATVPGSPSPSS